MFLFFVVDDFVVVIVVVVVVIYMFVSRLFICVAFRFLCLIVWLCGCLVPCFVFVTGLIVCVFGFFGWLFVVDCCLCLLFNFCFFVVNYWFVVVCC